MMLSMDIDEFVEAQRADGYSRNTIGARVRCVIAIARHAGTTAVQLTLNDVVAYFADRDLRPWSRRTYLNHLKVFGAWLGVNLIKGIRKPPAPRSTPDPLAEQDLKRLVDAAEGPHKLWILLGAFCGLRAHETAKLASADVVAGDGDEIVLRVTGKGGRTDVVPVPPVVLESLDLTVAGPLWPGVRPERVSRTIAAMASRLGIRMRYHQLRHRYGTAVYRSSGRDLLLTQRLMRHSSPATTAGYAAVADDQMHVVAYALPGAVPGRPTAGARKRRSRPCSMCG